MGTQNTFSHPPLPVSSSQVHLNNTFFFTALSPFEATAGGQTTNQLFEGVGPWSCDLSTQHGPGAGAGGEFRKAYLHTWHATHLSMQNIAKEDSEIWCDFVHHSRWGVFIFSSWGTVTWSPLPCQGWCHDHGPTERVWRGGGPTGDSGSRVWAGNCCVHT